MIVVRLMGGLGNQLFQFAVARRLSLHHDAELVLDVGWFRHEAPRFASPRRYELSRIAAEIGTIELAPRDVSMMEAGRRLRRRLPTLRVLRQREGDYSVDERVLRAGDDVLLIGYWQSELYFADVADTIRNDLTDSGDSSDKGNGGPALLADPSAVSVHFRRGDYISNPTTQSFHGVPGPEYYRRALEHVAERVPTAVFAAFSDDPEWVERELATRLNLTVISTGDAWQELRLMAQCAHHVIANSSFSWWAAWLGEHEGSTIVAPRRWFADPATNTDAIVPERWLRL